MITSTQNTKLKQIGRLRKVCKERKKLGMFLVEGPKMVEEAAAKGLIHEIYVSEGFEMLQKTWMERILSKLTNPIIEIVSDSVFQSISDTKSPQGILAITKMQVAPGRELFQKEGPSRFLLLENIQDPGNLGTLLRTAEGAGISGVILSAGTVDIYNPKVVRATMGSLFRVPFWYEEDWGGMLCEMKKQGIITYAADLKGLRNYYEEKLEERMAILVGNEANGLSQSTLDMVDIRVKLPMEGQLESLNASVAGGILMYEAYRQLTNVTR